MPIKVMDKDDSTEFSPLQQLLLMLFADGIGISKKNLEKIIQEKNEFEMPISDRVKWCVENYERCKDWFR